MRPREGEMGHQDVCGACTCVCACVQLYYHKIRTGRGASEQAPGTRVEACLLGAGSGWRLDRLGCPPPGQPAPVRASIVSSNNHILSRVQLVRRKTHTHERADARESAQQDMGQLVCIGKPRPAPQSGASSLSGEAGARTLFFRSLRF